MRETVWELTHTECEREKTFTHSCTCRQRHVAACCKPCEWHRLLWDKAKPPLLLGSGYEACNRGGVTGSSVGRPPYLLSACLRRPETPRSLFTPLSPFHDNHACNTLFPSGELASFNSPLRAQHISGPLLIISVQAPCEKGSGGRMWFSHW